MQKFWIGMMILYELYQIGTKYTSLIRLNEDENSSSSTKDSRLSLRNCHPHPNTKNALKSQNMIPAHSFYSAAA